MNTQSNTYTFLYAAILVVVVAAILSAAAMGLKPRQARNIEIEKKSNILTSVQKGLEASKAENKDAYIEKEYAKYITKSYVVNSHGEVVEGNAFTVDLNKENALPLEERKLPIFECKDDDGSIKYVLPIRGKGLWGPIWGYVALQNDMNTIYGAIFDHKGETPGLGAEINQNWFQKPFAGKQIFDNSGKFVSVTVVKGGAAPNDMHGVDAISGGTITSKGLEAMLFEGLSAYKEYFNKKLNK
jgi:Na+-transporting NADH:ubiquinone oxidoreductase subunit C